MRTILLACGIALGLVAPASGQTLRVEITDGESSTGMRAGNEPYVTGVPWAFIPARPLQPGVTPTVAEFRFRAWLEGDRVRVLVFAAMDRNFERDSPIASVSMSTGQSVEVTTEKYGGRPISISAGPLLPAMRFSPYTIRPYKGDTPNDPANRPWQPPAPNQR